ncbi:MAG: hypothetical protein IJJ43_06290 [Oscillospiraceae bacterium]|nr:hypothetical protein [Oscillospiraceae bacterium]MBQ6465857.1 hypothetical protein [Oscillospiraceae bacterium]
MHVRRYLLLTGGYSAARGRVSGPDIVELPHETLKAASDALRTEFEAVVKRVFGEDHQIQYGFFGEAKYGVRGEISGYNFEPAQYFFAVIAESGEISVGTLKEITVELSACEQETAYRMQERRYLLMDAESHLMEHVGYDPEPETDEDAAENEKAEQKFLADYGFSLSDAICEGSEFFILDELVEEYHHEFDCNIDINGLWEEVVREVLRRYK